jgi:hypothetical protein
MDTRTPTAREQFVEDYTLVIDNTATAYFFHLAAARKMYVADLADKLREDFEISISLAIDLTRKAGHETVADLISQMLIGYGSAPFDDIARHYKEMAGE